MNSVHFQVKRRITSKGRGTIVFPSDFKAIGNADAVKMALSRLAKEKTIVRLAQGIYLYPKTDPELGTLTASIESIAQAIAKRDGARIVPTGVYAMNRLGLSTQVPMKLIYLTDGSPRKVQIGRRTITFRRTSPKYLAMKGKITVLVVLGLQALGKEEVTPEVKRLIASALRMESKKILEHDMLLAPEWVAKMMRASLAETEN